MNAGCFRRGDGTGSSWQLQNFMDERSQTESKERRTKREMCGEMSSSERTGVDVMDGSGLCKV